MTTRNTRRLPVLVCQATHEKLKAIAEARRMQGYVETLGSIVDKIVERYEAPR